MSGVDAPGTVREAFDVEAAAGWLHAHAAAPAGQPTVQQFGGGASNLTYLLTWDDGTEQVLRRAPPGHKAKGAHDMAREFRLQQALKPVFPAVPTMIALCEDPSVLGGDFYVMSRLRGLIPRKRLPQGVPTDPASVRRLCVSVLDQLVDLHTLDVASSGLAAFGKGEGYVERQIAGWCRRYERSRTWNVPTWRPVMDWLRERMPEDAGNVLIHNDFRFDNVVLDPDDPTRVIGVLDWEMATLGCPLMDLGNTLAYWVEAGDDRVMQQLRRQPTHLPGMLTRREVVDHYAERTGRDVGSFTFYEVYGLFRLAVIVQQIYYRVHQGQSRNPAFKRFWLVNHYLRWRTGRVLRGRA